MQRRSTVTVGLVTFIAVILLPVMLNIATSQLPAPWEGYLWLAWPLAAVLGVVVLAAEVRRGRRGGLGVADRDQVRRAADDLAGLVARQWRAEAALRSLNQPAPIQLRWAVTARDVAAHPSAVLRTRTGAPPPPPVPAAGTLDDLTDTLLQLPNRQLVVLGAPGAGKSALAVMLTLDLLERRGPGEPLPLLLTLSGWNPAAEPLDKWIARRLREEYPALNNADRFGAAAGADLLDHGLLLPILDGLDEMPGRLRAVALAELNLAVAGGRPLVLTCRGDEYEAAVRARGVVLATALVVEIASVPPATATSYLLTAGPANDRRWAPVSAQLLSQPTGVLARALSTPLMIWLARMVYQPLTTDPAELLNPGRFGSRKAIEDHLLDAFLPAVYAALGPAHRPGFPQVRAWLAFLARHLHQQGTREITWWQLHRSVPRARLAVLAILLVTSVGALIALLYATVPALAPAAGFVGVMAVAGFPLGGLAAGIAGPPRSPAQLKFRLFNGGPERRQRMAFGVVFTAAAAVAVAPVGGLPLAAGVLFVGAIGSAFISALGWPDPVDAISPVGMYRDDRGSLLGCLVVGAAGGGLCGTLSSVLVSELPTGLAGGLGLALAAGASSYVVARSRRVAGARNGLELAALVLGGLLGGAIGAGLGPAIGGQLSGPVLAVGGLLGGLGLGLLGGLAFTASGWFGLTRAYLAARGSMPWDILTFLQDAQRRGVLRQAGAVYQFRHARLQDRLLDPAETRDQ